MAHTHEFDCKACGAHLDSREELDRHTRERHPDTMGGSQAGGGSEMRAQPPKSDGTVERS